MANFIYDKAREKFLTCGTSVGTTIGSSIDWLNDNIKMVMVITGAGHYVASQGLDEFLTAINIADRVQLSPNLSGKTATGGVANSSLVTFVAVPPGPAIGAIVVYKDTTNPATSPLIAYLDTITGLPVTPNGSDLVFVPDSGGNHIFKL